MAQPTTPPPFHLIDPDAAADGLGAPVDTTGFAAMADACQRGRADLAARGLGEPGTKTLRRFSLWEVTKYLIPMDPTAFRAALRDNPDLPQGQPETLGGLPWFTLDEVTRLRAALGGKTLAGPRPYRPADLPAKIVTVANFKGGVGKTSTCAHLAMAAAIDGYKVLAIDLDSQGSMTSIFGGQVADEWGTVFPLLARHYDTAAGGESNLTDARSMTASDVIQPTHWPNIDLIGAQLNLYWAEFQIPVWRMAHKEWRLWDALTDVLDQDGVLDEYDLIFVDTPPALGYLTINGLAAADILLVPLGASFLEFDSTARFFDMLHATFASIEEGDSLAARALGREATAFEWDAVHAVLTRYDDSQQGDMASLMAAHLGDVLSADRQDFTALIGQAGEQVAGLYEADYRDFNRETYLRGRATFDRTYADLKRLVVGAWRRDERALQDASAQHPGPIAYPVGAAQNERTA